MTEQPEEPNEINVGIRNFPPNGPTGELRTVPFGMGGPIRVLIEVDEDDGAMNIDLTLSNAAGNDEISAFLGDLIEMLAAINDNPETIAALVTAESETAS